MAYEFGKALPDQVTSEQLAVARSVVAAVCEIDPTVVEDGVVLGLIAL